MTMEYHQLGKTREKISAVGLGTWQFGDAWGVKDYNLAKNIIEKALEMGINLIDTAAVYGRGLSEEFIGKALKELNAREEVFIATKLPGEFLNHGDVFKATERCLKRLQTDVIDLMQVHWPPAWHNYPTCEYMRALEKLVRLGKIRYIGVSNFPPELLESAQACLAREEIVSNQVRYNVIEREAEKEIIPYAEKHGQTILAWSPLAKGAVTGKYTPDNLPKFTDVRQGDPIFHPENFPQIYENVVKLIVEIAKKYGKTPAQVSLNWLVMSSDTVVPIPGAKNPKQVEDNAQAVGWRLSYEDWRKIEEASRKTWFTRVTW